MNKQLTWVITIISFLALLGLISIQIFWIKNAIQLKAAKFNQNVSQALTEIVKKIETNEAITTIENNVGQQYKKQELFIKNNQGKLKFNYFVSNDTTLNKENSDFPDKHLSVIKNDLLHIDDSLTCFDYEILIKANSSIQKNPNLNNLSPDYLKINDGYEMQTQLNRIIGKVDFVENIINKLLYNSKPIAERVNPVLLDSFIKKSLFHYGIRLPYEYLIFESDSGYFVPKNGKFTLAKEPEKYAQLIHGGFKTELFPNDLFYKQYYLYINFPTQGSYLLSNLWKLLIISVIFIGLISLGFYYTISTIFRQKKLSDMKTDFINNMTHELKTPISTIALATEALKDNIVNNNTDRKNRFINIIYDENTRLDAHVQRVLQIAQMDKGDFVLNKSKIDLHELIKDVINKNTLHIEKKGGSIQTGLEATKSIISGDKNHLTNLLYNLIDNANKYSKEKVDITINTYDKKNGIVISVTDKGIGMSKQTIKKIFEKFYRVPTGNLHDVKGFGLGLSYIKSIIEAHHGTIQVKSELGKGSIFEVYLPLN